MIARFVYRERELDITNAPYSVGPGFVPPSASLIPNLAFGTSANIYGGGEFVTQTGSNINMAFTVRILVSGFEAVQEAARRLSHFLGNYTDKNRPMYFEFYGGDAPEPLWGSFPVVLRYEVVFANATLGEQYADSLTRTAGMIANVSLQLKPVPLGKAQRLGSAIGGVVMDRLGSEDGLIHGIRIPEATTNKMTNPFFTNATTPTTNWTAAASVVASNLQDDKSVFPCAGSGNQIPTAVRLTAIASTNNTFTQSINAGNTNKHSFSAVVRRPDGEAVTSSDCQIYYQSAQATTFASLGNGLYLAYTDNIDGINSAQSTGLLISNGRTIELLAYQMEEKAYHTYPAMGDLLGHAWTSTVGASTSTRTAARVRIDYAADTFDIGDMAVAVVWKPDFASTQTGDRYLFSCGSTSIRAYFNATDDKYYLTDNTNTISTAAQTFSAGDVIRLVFIVQPGELRIYVNGTSEANGATYSPPVAPTYMYIGTDDSAANPAMGELLLFQTYDHGLSQSEVTYLDTAITALTGNSRRPGNIPCLWTIDGDNVIDNALDSTHKNYAVALDIPGNLPAVTEITGLWGGIINWSTGRQINTGLYADRDFFNPDGCLFHDLSGTVDATANGGEVLINNTGIFPASATFRNKLLGRGFYIYARMYDESAGAGTVNSRFATVTNVVSGRTHIISTAVAFRLYNAGSIELPENPFNYPSIYSFEIAAIFTRASGTANWRVDYVSNLPRPCLVIGKTGDGGSQQYFTYKSTAAQAVAKGSDTITIGDYIPIEGDQIELEPDKHNLLITLLGSSAVDPEISRTMTYTKIVVEPRWRLI